MTDEQVFDMLEVMATMAPDVACVALPDLGTSLAVRDEPALAGRPVLLVRDGPAGPVAAEAGRAARLAGVIAGMRLDEAVGLCPDGAVRPERPEAAREAMRVLVPALRALTPAIELGGPTHVWLSLAGYATSLPDARAFGAEIAERASSAVGFPVRVALAPGRETSRLAARHAADRAASVVAGPLVRAFVAGLPLRDLGLPRDRVEDLRRLGLTRAGHLAALAAPSVEARFGAAVWRAYLLARGWDDPGVKPWDAGERVTARHAFAVSTASPRVVAWRVGSLARRLAEALAARYQTAATLEITLTLDDGSTRYARWPQVGDPPLLTPPSELPIRIENGVDGVWSGLSSPSARIARVAVSARGAWPTAAYALVRFRRSAPGPDDAEVLDPRPDGMSYSDGGNRVDLDAALAERRAGGGST